MTCKYFKKKTISDELGPADGALASYRMQNSESLVIVNSR